MKTFFSLLVIGSIAILPVANAAELKLGFVNASKILEDAPQAAAARDKLEKEFAPRDKDLVSQQDRVRSAESKLDKDSATLDDSSRVKKEREVIEKKRDLKRAQDEFREDFNIRRNEEFGKLQKLVYETIVSLAKSDGYDLIVGDGAIYASDRVDITDQILSRLKSGGSSSSSSSSNSDSGTSK